MSLQVPHRPKGHTTKAVILVRTPPLIAPLTAS